VGRLRLLTRPAASDDSFPMIALPLFRDQDDDATMERLAETGR
jgi:hypothetical protein